MSFHSYVHAALTSARIRTLPDSTYFGEVPGFAGVWAIAATSDKCRQTLQGVLEEAIEQRLKRGESLPSVGGQTLTLAESADLRPR